MNCVDERPAQYLADQNHLTDPPTALSELAFARVPADARLLAPLRGALSCFASNSGLTDGDVHDFVLATYEAMVNVVEHAYRHCLDVGTFDVKAVHDPRRGILTVTVADRGRWREALPRPSHHRGRGLTLMRSCSDSIEFNPGAGGTGTQVELRWSRGSLGFTTDNEQRG